MRKWIFAGLATVTLLVAGFIRSQQSGGLAQPNSMAVAEELFVTVRRGFIPEISPSASPTPFEIRIPFYPGLTLMAAISKAGGFTEFAKVKSVRILRAGETIKVDLRKLHADGSNNPLLQPWDVIVIPAG